MIKCKYCGIDFEPKSAKSIYCSTKCRVAGNRNKKVESIVTELEEEGIVTPIVTKCKGCGVEVIQGVCLCADCIKAGKTHASLGLDCHETETNMEETVRMGDEATKVLNANSVEKLREKGTWIPNWKKPNVL